MNNLNTKAIERLERRLEIIQDSIDTIITAGQGMTTQAGGVERAQLEVLMRYEKQILSEISVRTRGGYTIPTRFVRSWNDLGKGV